MTLYERVPTIQQTELPDALEAPPALTQEPKDGVFSNLSAKPTTKQEQQPPGYFDIPESSDPAPPYIEHTVVSTLVESGDVLIDGMPVGSMTSFILSMLISVLFDFIGYFMTSLFATTHAQRQGSKAGLGFTLIRVGLILESRTAADGEEETKNWIQFLFVICGALLLFGANVEFIQKVRERRLILSSFV